jgi:hypothetical protein
MLEQIANVANEKGSGEIAAALAAHPHSKVG